MAAAHFYCLNMVVRYCLLSSLKKAITLHIKRKLWKPMPTVMERASTSKFSMDCYCLCGSRRLTDNAYLQTLQRRCTLLILFLTASVSLYLSKTHIHTYACMWFPLQASKRDLEWWWGHGLIWESIKSCFIHPDNHSCCSRAKAKLFLCLRACVQVCIYICTGMCSLLYWKEVNT